MLVQRTLGLTLRLLAFGPTLGLLALTVPAGANVQPQAPSAPAARVLDPTVFPLPKQLEPNVKFWADIFAQHTNDHVLIHDDWHLDRIYVVLDFSHLKSSMLSDVERVERRRAAVRDEMTKIKTTLLALAAGKDSPYPNEQAKITALFAGQPKSELQLAAGRLRDQTGMRGHFAAALERSGLYMGHFERIFTSRSLPIELTRLPFIESMFQERARSKVAAGGLWQIMPSTGRRFLRVASDVDERYDPLVAAGAAGAVLRENYTYLGTWPLAVSAYNHGAGGLMRAVRNLGTTDLGTIATFHQSKTFKFASRNFYAEFYAAATLYENRILHFPEVTPLPEMVFDELVVDRYVPVSTLATKAEVHVDELKPLNPAVDHDVWAGRVLLPAGYRLRVPSGKGETFRAAYAALPAEMKLSRQAGGSHRVRGGETLSVIAKRYGVSVTALQQANQMGRRTNLRIGQTLHIPGRVAASAAQPAPAKTDATQPKVAPASTQPPEDAPAEATATDGRTYIVKKGDTLFSIARQLGVSVESLRRANTLSSSGRIYVGQKLKLAP